MSKQALIYSLKIALAIELSEVSRSVEIFFSIFLCCGDTSMLRRTFLEDGIILLIRWYNPIPHRYWKARISQALELNQLELHCQPIVDAGGKLYAEEILLRLNDGDRVIAAGEFIEAIAPYPNLISQIDWWVLENTFKKYANSSHKRHINISSGSLEKKGFALKFKRLADAYKCDIETVVIEVTEQLKIEDYRESLKIKAMGVNLAIDDFLTGYNSFDVLQSLHPQAIKIPGTLVGRISSRPGIVLIEAIIKIAASLSIVAIAEAVECEYTWTLLKLLAAKYDCKLYGQGYLFGRPTLCAQSNSGGIA